MNTPRFWPRPKNRLGMPARAAPDGRAGPRGAPAAARRAARRRRRCAWAGGRREAPLSKKQRARGATESACGRDEAHAATHPSPAPPGGATRHAALRARTALPMGARRGGDNERPSASERHLRAPRARYSGLSLRSSRRAKAAAALFRGANGGPAPHSRRAAWLPSAKPGSTVVARRPPLHATSDAKTRASAGRGKGTTRRSVHARRAVTSPTHP
jgi:hypothetical protein